MEQKFTVELTVSDWNVVLNALANRPYGEVFKVVSAIQAQAQAAEHKNAEQE